MNTIALTKNGMNPVLNIPDAHMGRRRIIVSCSSFRMLSSVVSLMPQPLSVMRIVKDFLTRGENSNANTVLAILPVLERMDEAVFKHRLHGKLNTWQGSRASSIIPVHINARKAKLHEGKIALQVSVLFPAVRWLHGSGSFPAPNCSEAQYSLRFHSLCQVRW